MPILTHNDELLIEVRKLAASMVLAEPWRLNRFIGLPHGEPWEPGFVLRTLAIDLAERRRTERPDGPVDEWVQTEKMAAMLLVLRYWRYVAHVMTRRAMAEAAML